MEIQRSDEICQKHCPRKFENLTATEKCPFNLIEWSIETENDKTKLCTRCSKMGAYLEEIIINRVIDITKGTFKLIKESITQRKIPIVPVTDYPKQPNQFGDVIYPNVPVYPQTPNINMPWVNGTSTDNTSSFNLTSETTIGEPKSDI